MTEPYKRKPAYFRLMATGAAVVASALLATFYGDALGNTPDVVGVIASIFSILAGVLIAVISILGDPGMLIDQTWRHSYLSARETQRKLHRNTDIFVLYIIILLALFVFMLLDRTAPAFWIPQKVVFFLVCLGFISSLALPFSLIAVQKQRLEDAIASKRSESQK